MANVKVKTNGAISTVCQSDHHQSGSEASEQKSRSCACDLLYPQLIHHALIFFKDRKFGVMLMLGLMPRLQQFRPSCADNDAPQGPLRSRRGPRSP
jgi:hypothetical protein